MILPRGWMVQPGIRLGVVLLTIAIARGQTPPAANGESVRVIADLSKQVQELRIEVAALRLEWHEQRMQALEGRIRAAERERRLAEYNDDAGREEVLAAEIQLASSDLDADSRAELTGLKATYFTEGQQQLQQRRQETVERESALREDWQRERAAAERLRLKLKVLRANSPAEPPARALE